MIRWEKVEVGKEGEGGGPGKRWGHTCNSINGGRHLYVFGGNDKYDCETNQVHVFDTVNQTWSQPAIKGTPPIPRDGHTCSVIGHRLFVFGGNCSLNELKDLHILDTSLQRWDKPIVKGEGPEARAGHSAAVVGKRLFIFGGSTRKYNDNYNEVYYNDLYILNTETLVWTRPTTLGTPPSPRDNHTCSSWKNKIIVIGGIDEHGSELSDVHILDTDTLIWRELSTSGQLLPPQSYHSTVSFGKNLFVFGGWTNGSDLCNDIYMLDIDTAIWTKVTNTTNCPSVRHFVAGDCLDPIKGVFVFMGGCNVNDEALDDMYYLYTEGIARESEERPEKLSIKKQLNLKCQEELNLFSSQNHTTAVPLDSSNMVDNPSEVEFDVEEFQNKLKKNPLAVLDGIISSFSSSKNSIVPLSQGSETSKSSKMAADCLIQELHSIAFERDLLEISKMSSFLRGAIDSFKPKIIAHEKMFTPQQLEHVQGLIHILEALLKADQELEAAKEQKIQADKEVETHLQEVTAARIEIEVHQKKVEEFISKETEIDNEIAVLRGKIKDLETKKKLSGLTKVIANKHLELVVSKVVGQVSRLNNSKAKVKTAASRINSTEQQLSELKSVYLKLKEHPL